MNNPVPYEKQCDLCEKEAIVGIGSPPVWVCLEHFAADLAAHRARILQALADGGGRLIG